MLHLFSTVPATLFYLSRVPCCLALSCWLLSFITSCLVLAPRPPAPEGWDKDNTHNTTREHNIISINANSFYSLLHSIIRCPALLIPITLMAMFSYSTCVLVLVPPVLAPPAPGGLG